MGEPRPDGQAIVSTRRLAKLHRQQAALKRQEAELLQEQASLEEQIALEHEAPSLSPTPPPTAASSPTPAARRRRRGRAPAQPSGPVDPLTVKRIETDMEKRGFPKGGGEGGSGGA